MLGIVFLVFNQNKNYFKMFLLYLANIHIGQIMRPNINTEDKKITFTKLLCVKLAQSYMGKQNNHSNTGRGFHLLSPLLSVKSRNLRN